MEYVCSGGGVTRGNTGNAPPQKIIWKKCCRKMMLFPKAFLESIFPKIVKKSIFLLKFYLKFLKFSQKIPNNLCFSSNERKINAGFVKFCGKYAKIMHFCTFLKKIFENFRKFSGPPRGRPPKMFPLRNEILATPLSM